MTARRAHLHRRAAISAPVPGTPLLIVRRAPVPRWERALRWLPAFFVGLVATLFSREIGPYLAVLMGYVAGMLIAGRYERDDD